MSSGCFWIICVLWVPQGYLYPVCVTDLYVSFWWVRIISVLWVSQGHLSPVCLWVTAVQRAAASGSGLRSLGQGHPCGERGH